MHGGVEIIDSRYRDFRFTLPDVVADNASTGCFVTGPPGCLPRAWTWPWRPACSRWTARSWTRPPGAAVQDPAEALALAANDLRRGLALEPGWIVLTGA